MSRTARAERVTRGDPGRGGARSGRHRARRYLHRGAVLRPHARPARQARRDRPGRAGRAATRKSTRTTRSRTPRSSSARRCARRSATRQGSAGSATRLCHSTRRWCRRQWTCRDGRTSCTRNRHPWRRMIGSYDTTLTRHIFESLASSAGICLHVRVLAGRNPHHIVEAQFKAVARALRDAAAAGPARRPACQAPRGCCEPAAPPEDRRARLRVGKSQVSAARPCPRRCGRRGDRRP